MTAASASADRMRIVFTARLGVTPAQDQASFRKEESASVGDLRRIRRILREGGRTENVVVKQLVSRMLFARQKAPVGMKRRAAGQIRRITFIAQDRCTERDTREIQRNEARGRNDPCVRPYPRSPKQPLSRRSGSLKTLGTAAIPPSSACIYPSQSVA